jgi:hypothetical protein
MQSAKARAVWTDLGGPDSLLALLASLEGAMSGPATVDAREAFELTKAAATNLCEAFRDPANRASTDVLPMHQALVRWRGLGRGTDWGRRQVRSGVLGSSSEFAVGFVEFVVRLSSSGAGVSLERAELLQLLGVGCASTRAALADDAQTRLLSLLCDFVGHDGYKAGWNRTQLAHVGCAEQIVGDYADVLCNPGHALHADVRRGPGDCMFASSDAAAGEPRRGVHREPDGLAQAPGPAVAARVPHHARVRGRHQRDGEWRCRPPAYGQRG